MTVTLASVPGLLIFFSRNQGGADNWGQAKKLLASDGASTDHFGSSVSISGDTAIVGAPYDDDNGIMSGSAYIFLRDQGGADNWGEVIKLKASDGAIADQFGISVSTSGDTAIVGTTYGNAVYVFSRHQGGTDTWGQLKKIFASDVTDGDYFGGYVSINGSAVIVGAPGDDDNGHDSGSAYIFFRDQGGANNWGEVKKLLASDGEATDFFGIRVSIHGDTAVVGAERDDDNGQDSGSAYIFFRDQGGANNWGEVKKLLAIDGAATDHFGCSVSTNGDTAIVGAYLSYSAYIFSRDQGGLDNWGEITKLTASDLFGSSVSISGDTVIVGAHDDDDNGSMSGAAYIFSPDLCEGDFEPDGDVDGADIAAYIVDSAGISLDVFAANFGRTNCSL